MITQPQQLKVPKTLDVEAVEAALAALWGDKTKRPEEPSEPVMRARVVNLIVFVTSEAAVAGTRETIRELATLHPCRALVMVADREGPDNDIEMFVSAACQAEGRATEMEVCCEEVTLLARGKFTSELTSAATPLLVSDLPVFLWWQDLTQFDDENFLPLSYASERLVIDTADLNATRSELNNLIQMFSRPRREAIAVTDINWARLTSWRALLANFYDVQEYLAALEHLDRVTVEYVASVPNQVAMQAFLISGWLASRLQWTVTATEKTQVEDRFLARRPEGGEISVVLKRVERPAMKPGRLAKIEFQTIANDTVFTVQRSEDGLHLETHAIFEGRLCPGRSLPVRNRSTGNLLAREMEILVNDVIYEAAVKAALSLTDN